MIDIFNLPDVTNNIQVFYENSGSWQMWNKPRGCNFVQMFALGGGGGGSGGVTGAANTTRRGGAGGGASAIMNAMFPAVILPSTLYIYVGKGGSGGGAGAAGTSGETSYVSVEPNDLPGSVLIVNGTPAGGGAAGGATAGTAGGAFTNQSYLIHYGVAFVTGGVGGGIGGSGAIGTSLTLQRIVTGGAGGGGPSNTTNFAGGQISGAGIFPTLLGGVGGATTVASNGYYNIPSSSISNSRPMFFMGGSGGGSNRTGTGGVGGNGTYGCGGGGGGGGTTGGRGGDGGDGLVIITCW